MSIELTKAYTAVFEYKHRDSFSNMAAQRDLIQQFNDMTDPLEKAEFATNLATHTDAGLSKLGHHLMSKQLSDDNHEAQSSLRLAVSQLTDTFTNHDGETWSFNDHMPAQTRVDLWQLSRDHDMHEQPGRFEHKQHGINTALSESLAKNDDFLTEQDVTVSLQPGQFIPYSLVSLGASAISEEYENVVAMDGVVSLSDAPSKSAFVADNIAAAQKGVEKLKEGDTLLVPVLYNNHFGSVQVTKEDGGYTVCVFDSRKTDKAPYEDVIGQLNLQGKVNKDYCLENFQAQNDCAVHVTEFFQHCAENPNTPFKILFDDYKQLVEKQNVGPDGMDTSKRASEIRRQDFIMNIYAASE